VTVGVPDPAATDLHVGALDRRPGDAMRPFLLARIIWMRRKGVIERFAVDVLGVRGEDVTAQERATRCWNDMA